MSKVFCPKSSTTVVKTLVTPILHLWLFYTGWLWLRFRLHFQWACMILSWGIHTGFRLRFSLTSIVTFSKLKSESASVTKPLQWAITFASFLRCNGLFPPTETDSDSDFFPDGYIVLYRTFSTGSDLDSDPCTESFPNGYSTHFRNRSRSQGQISIPIPYIWIRGSESKSEPVEKPA